MVTVIAWVVVMLDVEGVTTILGVTLATITLPEAPEAVLYIGELETSGV